MTTIRFIYHDGREQDVVATDGESVMRAAINHGVSGIAADCGGCLTCATCHVYVPEEWFNRLESPSENEVVMLEGAVDPGPTSRLSCQITVSPAIEGACFHVPKSQF